jgi:phage pi2 protein 07
MTSKKYYAVKPLAQFDFVYQIQSRLLSCLKIYPNELWIKLKDIYLSKSLASRTTLKNLLYKFMMKKGMNLSVHLGAFNTLVREVFNTG